MVAGVSVSTIQRHLTAWKSMPLARGLRGRLPLYCMFVRPDFDDNVSENFSQNKQWQFE
jgi:hypothetical protein